MIPTTYHSAPSCTPSTPTNRCHQGVFSAGLILTLLLLTSCDDLMSALDYDPFEYDECQTTQGNASVDGDWVISGRGSRTGCDDSDYDGDFLLTSQELRVNQLDDAADTADRLELEYPMSLPGGSFTLSGTVRGSCVDFTLEERGTMGTFTFTFDGSYSAAEIAGEFTGQGPPGCESTGTFRIGL